MELVRKLQKRIDDGNPIAVGIVGCGQMGSGLAHTINNVDGMTIRSIADIDPQRGISTFHEMGIDEQQIVVTESASEGEDAIRNGKYLVTPDAMMVTSLEGIEANVEATGVTDIGARIAYNSILNRKPVIMLNVETDITVGYYLNNLARKMGTVYSVASGDEPGVCKMLYEQARLMGFQVVTLGKGKNNPINFDATVESAAQEAASKGMNPKMLAAFQDGTKTMVEMAAVSNATGLIPDTTGMHGPNVKVEDLVNVFIPSKDGGIFSAPGRVDFSTGPIAPGVFAIVYSEDKRIQKEMKFITKADGPYYLHLRPYHLCDLETPQSVAEAVLLNEVTVTAEGRYAEVVCKAKRDLKPGQKVEGIGGHDWYGTIMEYSEAVKTRAVSIGIGTGGTVTAPVKKGQILTEDLFAPDTSSFVYRLRKLQESMNQGGV